MSYVKCCISFEMSKAPGRWLAAIDVTREDADAPLAVVFPGPLGKCRFECRVAQARRAPDGIHLKKQIIIIIKSLAT